MKKIILLACISICFVACQSPEDILGGKDKYPGTYSLRATGTINYKFSTGTSKTQDLNYTDKTLIIEKDPSNSDKFNISGDLYIKGTATYNSESYTLQIDPITETYTSSGYVITESWTFLPAYYLGDTLKFTGFMTAKGKATSGSTTFTGTVVCSNYAVKK